MITIHKSYKDLESLKEYLVEQGSVVQIAFPTTFTKEMYDLYQEDNKRLKPGCGCTSYTINQEREEILFKVQAPSFQHELQEPYLKSVMPKFFFPDGRQVHWDIKFYVNNIK